MLEVLIGYLLSSFCSFAVVVGAAVEVAVDAIMVVETIVVAVAVETVAVVVAVVTMAADAAKISYSEKSKGHWVQCPFDFFIIKNDSAFFYTI